MPRFVHAPHPASRLAGPASRDGLRTSCAAAAGPVSLQARPRPRCGSALCACGAGRPAPRSCAPSSPPNAGQKTVATFVKGRFPTGKAFNFLSFAKSTARRLPEVVHCQLSTFDFQLLFQRHLVRAPQPKIGFSQIISLGGHAAQPSGRL